MLPTILLLALVGSTSAFRLPFQVLPAVTNITQGGQTLEQTANYFVANLTIGTPGQLFTVIIDTTTSDLVIPDKSCTTENNCYNKRKFDQTKSSSYYGYTLQYNYKNNAGSFHGFVGKDTAVIGDRKTDLITIPAVRILQATTIGLGMNGLEADGVLGLSFSQASQIDGPSPFVQGVNQGDISNTFFSIWLEHYNQTDDFGTHGVIYYGGFDPVHCAPNPSYVPLSSSNYYQMTVTNFKSAGSAATNSYNRNTQSIIDSTTSLVSAPTTIISQILDSIGININTITAYPPVVPCNTKLTLTVTFTGGATATITERDLVTGNGVCRLNILPSNNGQITFGIPFLRGRCTYFDPILQKIGLTPALLQN